jgi:hypothetical protein
MAAATFNKLALKTVGGYAQEPTRRAKQNWVGSCLTHKYNTKLQRLLPVYYWEKNYVAVFYFTSGNMALPSHSALFSKV